MEAGRQAVPDGRGIAQGETLLLLIHIRSYKVLAFNNIPNSQNFTPATFEDSTNLRLELSFWSLLFPAE